MLRPRLLLLLAALTLSGQALAQLSDSELAAEPPPEGAEFDHYADLVPDTPEGAVSWDLLGSTGVSIEEIDGRSHLRPDFPDELKALDGETIRIKGFMYPTEQQEYAENFLFTALPPSCPFCLPAGAGYIIDAHAASPIRFTWDAVQLEGRLELLPDDRYGLYYRLVEARPVR